MRTHRNQERGMTMMELLIVLAIGAILLMVAIPSFMRTKYHIELQGAAQTFVSDLRTTQANAIRQAATVTLDQTTVDQSVRDYCSANRCIVVDGGGTSVTSISFNSSGYVSAPAVMPFSMTLKACQTGETLKVQVERTGRIQKLSLAPSAC